MGIEVLIVLFNVTLYLMVQAFSMMFFYEGIFEDGVGRPPPAVLIIYYYYGAFQLLYVAANVMYYRHYTLPRCSRTTDIEIRYEAEILLMSDYTIGFSTSGYLIAVLSYGLSPWIGGVTVILVAVLLFRHMPLLFGHSGNMLSTFIVIRHNTDPRVVLREVAGELRERVYAALGIPRPEAVELESRTTV